MEELTSKSLIKSNLEDLKSKNYITSYHFDTFTENYVEYDFVEIKTSSVNFKLTYDVDELDGEDGEINQVKKIENAVAYTDSTISFLLSDQKSEKKLPEGKTIKIQIGNDINVKLKKDKQALGILLTNLSNVIDLEKAVDGETYTLSEIVKDDIIVVVLEHAIAQELETFSLDTILDSLKLQMIYHNHINLIEIKDFKKTNTSNIPNELKEDLSARIFEDVNPLKYFLFAETVEYPHLKYLEYYHVLEYYFLHKRMKDIDNVVKDLIFLELSNKIDKSIDSPYYKSLISLFDIYFKQEDINISEQQQLEYVLKDDIGYRNLVQSLNALPDLNFLLKQSCEINNTAIGVIKKNEEIFKQGKNSKFISCDNKYLTDTFCSQLTNRIYKTRNFIVHSKKYERSKVFTPTPDNLKSLHDEVKLIRAIAYVILNKY